MQQLMAKAHLAPPTFESSREDNEFISRLLLHHFLDEKDLKWLMQFENFDLSDNQKKALIFVREVEAIDNASYRQISYCDVSKASSDLRKLKGYDLLISKGKGRATYYVPGKGINKLPAEISTTPLEISTQGTEISTQGQVTSTQPRKISTQPHEISTQPYEISTPPSEISTQPRVTSTQPQEISTQGNEISTQGNEAQGNEISTQGNEISTQGNEISTQGTEISTQGTEISTQGTEISTQGNEISTQGNEISTQGNEISTQGTKISTQGNEISTQGNEISTQGNEISTQGNEISTQPLIEIPKDILKKIFELKQREHDKQKVIEIIKNLCSIRALSSDEIAGILNKREDYIRRKYLNKMIERKELRYQRPEMISHPEQAYITNSKQN